MSANPELTNGTHEPQHSAVHLPRPNPGLWTTKDHRIYSAPSPELKLGPDDCIVHVRVNGICGSDLHFWKSGAIGTCIVEDDYILGHEGAGEIFQVGSNVTHLKPSDKVAIEPGMPCEQCYHCTTGDYNLCPDVAFSGVWPYHGSIRRYHVHRAKYLHKIPSTMDFTEGALLEPLSVVLHGMERSPLRLGQPVLICGTGPIGLIALAAAKASGGFPLVITDVDAARLSFAKQFVPECETFLIPLSGSPEEHAAGIRSVFVNDLGSEEPPVVYECTGVQSSVHTASYACKRGGEVMVIGVGRAIMDGLPFMHLSLAEIDLKFINRYHHSWPFAIRLMQSGYINLKPLVTHTFTLEEAVTALETAGDRTKASVKIHIVDN
ncbi:GroES-like protein [Mollisia scopiformis]|uniref:GroES-like protein n=1 Tax=Mollisia scopiformis TaxID=149040 RepID=A0A132B7I7_MOLSC|nr:GroES-like protein [Mollisia scopiformis]KUJ08311.1 GroES-like protein [Mollisia scopiformis]